MECSVYLMECSVSGGSCDASLCRGSLVANPIYRQQLNLSVFRVVLSFLNLQYLTIRRHHPYKTFIESQACRDLNLVEGCTVEASEKKTDFK